MALILLVEDNRNQRLLYQQELEADGHEVITAATGKEALKAVKNCQPHLIVLDVLLPDCNGIDVMEELLGQNINLPVIIHSAYSSPQHDFVTWFAKAYVVKSGNLDVLKYEVRCALEARHPSAIA